jgi:pre-mRNA-splicing factor ATP-dependent RNA helicase DHX15/PRP43
MSTFPLEPQLAKMLIVSPEFKCSNEILSIAAMLSGIVTFLSSCQRPTIDSYSYSIIVPNPYLRPNSQRKEADEAKAQFAHPKGDHLSLLNVYHAYRGNPDANWCWSNYVSHRAMQQADNVRNQLKRSMEKLDLYVVLTAFLPYCPRPR